MVCEFNQVTCWMHSSISFDNPPFLLPSDPKFWDLQVIDVLFPGRFSASALHFLWRAFVPAASYLDRQPNLQATRSLQLLWISII